MLGCLRALLRLRKICYRFEIERVSLAADARSEPWAVSLRSSLLCEAYYTLAAAPGHRVTDSHYVQFVLGSEKISSMFMDVGMLGPNTFSMARWAFGDLCVRKAE